MSIKIKGKKEKREKREKGNGARRNQRIIIKNSYKRNLKLFIFS